MRSALAHTVVTLNSHIGMHDKGRQTTSDGLPDVFVEDSVGFGKTGCKEHSMGASMPNRRGHRSLSRVFHFVQFNHHDMDGRPLVDVQADNSLVPSIAPSASIQARIAMGQHRHRASGHQPHVSEKDDLKFTDLDNGLISDLPRDMSSGNVSGSVFPSVDLVYVKCFLAQRPRLKWFLAVYCSFSLMFWTSGMFLRLASTANVLPSRSTYGVPEASPLQFLPVDYLMSKFTTINLEHQSLHPHFIRPLEVEDPSGVTACLWTDMTHIHLLPAWTARWKGHVSALVTTRTATVDREGLLEQLSGLQKYYSENATLSIHVLQLQPHAEENPNAFLNLARLFAQTSTVALFPGDLSSVPPKTFSRSLLFRTSSKPTVFSMRGRNTFPFSPLSPVVLSRDDPLWCTERFFPHVSRAADWQECLWQLWLEHFGDIEARPTTDWVTDPTPASAVEIHFLPSNSRRRLSTKFRGETCVLATRQLAALRTQEHGMDTKKARWLKRNCRQWTSSSGS